MRAIRFLLAGPACAILIAAGQVHAASITGVTTGEGPATSPDKKFVVSLSPDRVKPQDGPTQDELTLLKSEYPKWDFKTSSSAAPGTFNILEYTAFALNTLGGAEFSVLYDDGVDPARTDYDWIQIAHPHNWGSADSKDKVDATFSNFPFYANYTPIRLADLMTPTSFFGPSIWLDGKNYPQQKIQNPGGGGKVPKGDLLFEDEPFCSYTCTEKDGTASDVFDLFLVTFTWNGKGGDDAGGTVTLYDGIKWGVEITPVPGPSTGVLVGMTGLIGLGVLYWRQSRRS